MASICRWANHRFFDCNKGKLNSIYSRDQLFNFGFISKSFKKENSFTDCLLRICNFNPTDALPTHQFLMPQEIHLAHQQQLQQYWL